MKDAAFPRFAPSTMLRMVPLPRFAGEEPVRMRQADDPLWRNRACRGRTALYPVRRMSKPIFKICPRTLWQAAEKAGRFDGMSIDLSDGYIHFSNAEQARETARLHFAGVDDLLLITVDGEALGEELRWEPSRGGQLFPHLYGSLPMSAVLGVAAMPVGPDGVHVFPAGIP
jgi:uncharacterized protein (DUF952 family)